MQIDPASLTTTTASAVSTKTAPAPPPTTQKAVKALIAVPRLEIEPIYTELKNAVGNNWSEYKQAATLFLLGHLNQNEFFARVATILHDLKLEHLHNNFICAILGNLTRNLPDHGVASWVSANDKPTVVSKPASGDAAEQRLKTEVMQLPPRDRRRLKSIPEPDPYAIPTAFEEYQLATQIRLPDQVPASAGGLNKTNWELEIRKRYAQPLASETGEFPDSEAIHARMTPICYEESVSNGASFSCAVYMAVATENFVKGVLSSVYAHTRSNGPSGTLNGTMTRKYRQQLEREEMAFTRGELGRNPLNGLLPVEAKEASARQAIGLRDLQLTVELNPGVLGPMPLLISEIMGGYLEEDLEAERQSYLLDSSTTVDEPSRVTMVDDIEMEDDTWEWDEAVAADQKQLSSILDDCLSMAA